MAAAKLSVPWRPGRAGSFAPDPASRIFRRQNDLAPPDRLFQRSLVLVTSYIRGHAFFYGATPGFFQRRQLGHGFILIIKERQHVADNGRGCCHVAAMFKYAGRRIARIVCWRETLKQGMITKFEGQCCIAPDTACPFSHCDTAYLSRACFPRQQNIRNVHPCTSRCRSEEHTSELKSLMRISYAVFCMI